MIPETTRFRPAFVAAGKLPLMMLCAAVLLLPGGVGCASRSLSDLPAELRASSVVSSRGPGPALGPSGVWTWMPGSGLLVPSGELDSQFIENTLRDALVDNMADRGWSLTGASGAEVQLGFLVATDRVLDDAAIRSRFGMNPGLASEGTRYGKGTLIVELRRPGSPQALWRGSIQIIAEPTLSADLRRQRIRQGVASVLRSMPVGG